MKLQILTECKTIEKIKTTTNYRMPVISQMNQCLVMFKQQENNDLLMVLYYEQLSYTIETRAAIKRYTSYRTPLDTDAGNSN